MKKHPVWNELSETVLALLSGGFVLLTVGIVWIKELIEKKKK